MEIFDVRDYDLFAMLADVRNGRGFAGCVTGDGFEPISKPKGLPEDIGIDLKKHSDGDCGHSASYLTLKELLDYTELSKNMYTNKQGLVTVDEYILFKETGVPDSWYRDVGGYRASIISNEEMENIELLDSDHSYYTRIEWKVNYYEWAWKKFEEQVINRWIKEYVNPYNSFNDDEIRIVFWFDS